MTEIRDIAMFCKKKEIEALERAKGYTGTEGYVYWDAKAQAFSQIWEYIVFEGKSVGNGIFPQEYNKQNEIWSKEATEK